jgi:hypothetical protein
MASSRHEQAKATSYLQQNTKGEKRHQKSDHRLFQGKNLRDSLTKTTLLEPEGRKALNLLNKWYLTGDSTLDTIIVALQASAPKKFCSTISVSTKAQLQ